MDTIETLERFQRWFDSMTDGDWHHTYGVSITTIDNPGWSLRVELSDTYLFDRQFDEKKIQRKTDNDWLLCRKDDGVFQAYGGPENLDEMISLFLDWAEICDCTE
jgi:hypothetical protein